METLNDNHVPQYKFLIIGLMALLIIVAAAFWVRDKKNISWEKKYEHDIIISLKYVPDSLKRQELINELKK